VKIVILGDIHANYSALSAVLSRVDADKTDACYCVGDLVGYGAEPSRVIEEVRRRGIVTVAGNHDHAVVRRLDPEYFNPFARASVFWTRDRLSPDELDYLAGLPLQLHTEHFTLVHGSVHEPEGFHYIQTLQDAEASFDCMVRPLAFIGHSHVPVSFFDGDPVRFSVTPRTPTDPSGKTIVNVGAIGQPRDEDPRAAYAVYDTKQQEVLLKRVSYDIEDAVRKILDSGLPEILGERLRFGR
jgi:predicted phosphodiesterase